MAALEREMSMLKRQLADSQADVQARLEGLQTPNKDKGLSAVKSEAQLKVAGLEGEVLILQKQLADAKTDAQRRLEQLEARLAHAERARKEQAAREAEALLQVRWHPTVCKISTP